MVGYSNEQLKAMATPKKVEVTPAWDVEKMAGGGTEEQRRADLAAVTQALMEQRKQNANAMSPGGATPQIDAALLAALGQKKGV